MAHNCVGILTIIGSDNGLPHGRRQAIISPNSRVLLIEPSGTNFSKIWSKFIHFCSRKCIWKGRLQNCDHFVSASMFWTIQRKLYIYIYLHWFSLMNIYNSKLCKRNSCTLGKTPNIFFCDHSHILRQEIYSHEVIHEWMDVIKCTFQWFNHVGMNVWSVGNFVLELYNVTLLYANVLKYSMRWPHRQQCLWYH